MFWNDDYRSRTGSFRLTRRNVLLFTALGAAAVPAARIGWLRSKDRPLPETSGDDLTLDGGWLLDAGEASAGTGEAR